MNAQTLCQRKAGNAVPVFYVVRKRAAAVVEYIGGMTANDKNPKFFVKLLFFHRFIPPHEWCAP